MKERNEKKLKSFTTGLAIGGILAGGGVYAATVSASNVSYNNSTTGINSSNVQGAIDSLKVKVNGLKHENERYTHVRYFYHCHSYEINGNQWGTCGNSSIYGVSTDANGYDYVKFQLNLGTKESSSLIGGNFNNARNGCCSTMCKNVSEVTACNAICKNGYNQNYLTT